MLGIGSLILGGINTIGGLIGLATQPKTPDYKLSPDMQAALDQSREMQKRGFTGAEEAAYKQQIASQSQAGYQRGLDLSGGNMAQAMLSARQSAELNAANQMAIRDAALRRQNIQNYQAMAGQQQNILDRNTQRQIQENMMRQEAFGKALQSGLSQLGSFANMIPFGGSMGDKIPMGVVPRIQSPGALGGYDVNTSPVIQSWMNSGKLNLSNLDFSKYNYPFGQ